MSTVTIDFRWKCENYQKIKIRTVRDVQLSPSGKICRLVYVPNTKTEYGFFVDACSLEAEDRITNIQTGETLDETMPMVERYKRIKAWLEGDVDIPLDLDDIIL